MTIEKIKEKFESAFDLVGIIHKDTYQSAAKKQGRHLIDSPFETLLVLGYAYPKRIIKQTHTHLVPSFYTFGKDYHLVLKQRILEVMKDLPYQYIYGVDDHPLDERLLAELAGLGFKGKNQLIINQTLGSYFFLGYVLMDVPFKKPFVTDVSSGCGDCRICIDACPTNALSEQGYIMEKCISYFNQVKAPLTLEQIKANYQLFGCDICQLVCPKNINKGEILHPEFKLSGKEKISIKDLFEMTQKEFYDAYKDMAYLWKGKTLLMRNAAMVMYRQKNTKYLDHLANSLKQFKMPWYQKTTTIILNELKKIESS